MIEFQPFEWRSEPPGDNPFEPSEDIVGVRFLGRCTDYKIADSWFPSWASDGRLYSGYTDGYCPRLDGGKELAWSDGGQTANTGNAVMEGDDPLDLKIYSLGVVRASALPYPGRYPCASLTYDGVWYYGTFCVGPEGMTQYGGATYNWPWLGPFVGFRISSDYGRTWQESPHTPENPLFGESGLWGHPVKLGSPHVVDFGKNMEHSPDGKAYLVAHGAEVDDPEPRFANLTWISGDQIYLIRVTPTIENINDRSKYEFFAGHTVDGRPIWTRKFSKIQPLIDWNNNCGCVTISYNAPLKKYLMCVTDGWPTVKKMHSYILEADEITGPYRMIVYMKEFGMQGYFLNFPTKFIEGDGRRLWLCYSANWTDGADGPEFDANPPGSRYGLVLQQVELI